MRCQRKDWDNEAVDRLMSLWRDRSVSDIAAEMHITRSAVTSKIKRLRDEGRALEHER
jgi:hypothetical protein